MTETALAIINEKPLAEYFAPHGLDPVIEKIREEVASFAPDISSAEGRKEIASMAYKVARSKTALDEMGKNLVSGMKAQVKVIDAERSRAWDAIEQIQKDVRKPLTDWERKEEERIAVHKADIDEMVEAGRVTAENWQSLPLDAMKDRLGEIESSGTKDWQEFATLAAQAREQAITSIKAAIVRREAYDHDQAELARLRKESEERERREREEVIKAGAAAKAKAEAEAAAKAEQDKLQREIVLAEERAKKAEEDRRAAEEKARSDALEAEARAKREAEAAVGRERLRAEAQQKEEERAAAERERDKKHRAKINNEAVAALVAAGLDQDKAKAAVEAIARGEIPNVKIIY